MTDARGPDLSKASLVRHIPLWLNDLVPSKPPLDRVIDGAILSFVIFSVLSITAAQASILVALAAWTCKLLRSAERGQLRLPLLLPGNRWRRAPVRLVRIGLRSGPMGRQF